MPRLPLVASAAAALMANATAADLRYCRAATPIAARSLAHDPSSRLTVGSSALSSPRPATPAAADRRTPSSPPSSRHTSTRSSGSGRSTRRGSATTASTTGSTTSRRRPGPPDRTLPRTPSPTCPSRSTTRKLSPRRPDRLRDPPHDLTRSLWLAENTQPFEDDPRVYNEYITDSVYLLLTQSTLPQGDQRRATRAARMAFIPQGRRRGEGQPAATRRASSSRRPSARTAAPSPSTRAASSSWPARRRSSAS